MRATRLRKWLWGTTVVVLLPVAGFFGANLATDNFGTVPPGRVLRSGQMRAETLDRTVRSYRVQTVLNLRGAHPEQVWYRAERQATLDAGATQIDMALSSCEWMSRVQLQALVRVLDTCERPVLIHCWHGSERTGLAAALAVLLQPGSTLEQARAQFSWRYLYIHAGDGKITFEHLEQYAGWLRRERLEHTPDHLRQWAAEGFQPGTPGREQWPYDPYPLVVVSRPAPRTAPIARRDDPAHAAN